MESRIKRDEPLGKVPKTKLKRGIALFSVFIIIALLIYVGPADALILGMSIAENEVFQGEIIEVNLNVDIEQGELLDPDKLVFSMLGAGDYLCEFSPNGSVISGCNGIIITNCCKI